MSYTNVASSPVVSCIIPFYNEQERIIDVLRVVTKIAYPIEIICVDDGSKDNGAKEIRKIYPTVTVIRNRKNKGKTAAIAHGAALARGTYTLLLDADLRNLNALEISSALNLITKNTDIDMLILRRKFDPFISKMLRGDVLVSGERILRTSDLLHVLKTNVKAYEIEPAINRYMLYKKARVGWCFHSGTNVPKIKKIGFLPGIKQELKYYQSVISYYGLKTYIQTLVVFCHDDIDLEKQEGQRKQNLYILKQLFTGTFRQDIFQFNSTHLYRKRLQQLLMSTKKSRMFIRELMRDF